MANKCFCHLNGYAVKDATARKDIEFLKKVANEELYSFLTDSIPAYKKEVPATALQYATIDKIGGLSSMYDKHHGYNTNGKIKCSSDVSCSQYNGSDFRYVISGTFSKTYGEFIDIEIADKMFNLKDAYNKGGTINFNITSGTSDGAVDVNNIRIDFITMEDEVIFVGYNNFKTSFTLKTPHVIEDKYIKSIRLSAFIGTITLTNLYVSILGGYTADRYPELKPTAIKYKSPNLLDPKIIDDGDLGTYRVNEDGSITLTWTDTRNWGNLPRIELEAGDYTITAKGTNLRYNINNGTSNFPLLDGETVTITASDGDTIAFKLYVDDDTYPRTAYPMLNKGAKALPYSPYGEKVLIDIPEEVRSLDGFGLTMSETIYNYIDFETLDFVKMCEQIDGEIYALADPIYIDVSSYFKSGNITVEPYATIIFENDKEMEVINSVSYNLKL